MKNTALTLRLPLSEEWLPAAMAARGEEGIVEGLDYRGVPVLAAVQRIPDSPWSLVAKVDSVEIYASLRERLLFTMGLVGALIAVAGVSLGLTWRHKHAQYYRSQYEAEVRHNALLQRYEYLTRHANDIILLLDRQGRIVEANERALASYGYTRDELLQLHIRDLWAPQTAPAVDAEMQATHEVDGSVFETMHRRKDGTVFAVEVSSRIVEIEGEGFFQDIIRDITERKRAEEKLKQALADLERSNKDLEQFAYVASHDLQEPLRKVASFTELLAKRYEGKLDRNADRYIDYIVDGAKRMHVLINDLLAYSRVSTSTEKYVQTDCTEVITQVLDDMRKTIRESGAAVTYDHLPTVTADPTQIGRVFQNLIANAIKFRRDEPPRIHISARREGRGWIFSVSDNGIGIQPEFFDRIFLMFQRLHTRAEYPGTGIGLAICKKIIERHGGHIWLESEVDKGSTFYFSIPEKTGGG
ncbi:MAG: sensor histidine kinase [Chloroflexota bacterium]